VGGERGFTLVEAVVAMTIFSFVTVLVAALYLHGYQNYSRESERIEVQESLRIAANKMASKIRQGTGIKVYSKNGPPDEQNPGPWIEFNEGKSGFRFVDSGGKEVEEKNDTNWQPLASNIKSLIFNYDENRQVVTISIVGETDRSGPVSLSTTVHLRVSQDSR
jgi:prepilin-type N-terminal cleavage/methylation domain-containing protein